MYKIKNLQLRTERTIKKLGLKVGDKILVKYSRGDKLKKSVIMFWSGEYSRTGQPLLKDKDDYKFRALSTDLSHLITGDVYNL